MAPSPFEHSGAKMGSLDIDTMYSRLCRRITSTRSTSKVHLNMFQYSVWGAVMTDAITYSKHCCLLSDSALRRVDRSRNVSKFDCSSMFSYAWKWGKSRFSDYFIMHEENHISFREWVCVVSHVRRVCIQTRCLKTNCHFSSIPTARIPPVSWWMLILVQEAIFGNKCKSRDLSNINIHQHCFYPLIQQKISCKHAKRSAKNGHYAV